MPGVVDSRLPPDVATRIDPTGHPISLDHTGPRAQAVLFTGAPGMGKSTELARTHAYARDQGWTVLRADASPREPLESRFIRAVDDQLGALRKQHGFWAVRKLKKTLRDLAPRKNDAQNGAELRFGMMPVQAVVKRQWAAPDTQGPGATLNELADRLGELSARQGKPAIIMIDNVDVASDRDLAAVNELAAHLKSNGHVFLVAAGGEQATTRLMNASRGMSGVETDIGRRYDLRECRPLTDDEIRPVLTAGLARQGVVAEPLAVDALVQSANGSPQRLGALSEQAVRLAHPDGRLTTGLAAQTVAVVNDQSRLYYEASWNNSSSEEKNLLAQTAVRGERGLSLPAFTRAAGIDKFPKIDAARQSLKARGLVRESEAGRVKFGDPGMQEWVRAHVGDSVPHQGVPLDAALGRAADYQQGVAPLSPGAHGSQPAELSQGAQSSQAAQLNQAAQVNQAGQSNQGARARVPAPVDRRGGGYHR